MPIDLQADIEITGFRWVPDFARGFVRDLRPRWACEEAGLAYRERLIDFDTAKGADYRREQPFGQVPAYRDAEVRMFESGAMVLRIAERSDVLLPADVAGRARVLSWVTAALNSVEPFVFDLVDIDMFNKDAEWAKLRRPQAIDNLRGRLEALDGSDRQIGGLRRDLEAADAAYAHAAEALRAARKAAARTLDKRIMAELAPLKMDRAVFSTQITQDAPGPTGTDAVTFTVATNPGAPSGPLNRIASGGELSRFLLAMKVCLSERATGLTMIFDEIDRGVGGATADAVGRRLKALAEDGQVLVVTHSPQVAALGAHHWRVEKAVSGGMTLSRVVPLDASARVDEVARMLSGDTVTEAARAAAKALLPAAATG